MKNILLYFIFFSLSACGDPKHDVVTTSASFYNAKYCDSKKVDSLKDKINLGDTVAYNELREIYSLSNNIEEFLLVSIRMAKRFEYDKAYFDAYICMIRENAKSPQKFTVLLADYFLIRSYELGNKDAKSNIIERFGVNSLKNLPSSKEQLKLLAE